MKFKAALSALQYKKSSRFVLIGKEEYFKWKFMKCAEMLYPDIMTMNPEDSSEINGILNSESLFDNSALILNDFDKMDIKSFEKLILAYDGLVILNLTHNANTRSRFLSTVLSKMILVECDGLRSYGSDFPVWIGSIITDFNFTYEEGVEDEIFIRIGPQMFAIYYEIKKLILLKSDEKHITISDVRDYTSFTAKSTAFELFENLMKKDIKKSLESFNSYTKNKSTFIDVIGFLGSYFERVYKMLLLKEEKLNENDIATIIGIPRFLVKTKYLPKALSFGKNAIADKINSLCDIDAQVRIFKGDKRILMEKFIMDFANV